MMTNTTNDVIDAPDFAQSPQSGRAVFDERGNSIWEWQTAPGVFSREVSSQQLVALQASDLQVVEDRLDWQQDTAPAAWSRHHSTPRKLSKDRELVMPMRGRATAVQGFESFIKRLALSI